MHTDFSLRASSGLFYLNPLPAQGRSFKEGLEWLGKIPAGGLRGF